MAMGADEALGDDGYDRFAAVLPQAQAAPILAPTQTAAQKASEDARDLALNARTLDELKSAMEGFGGCILKKTAMRTVFADGNPQARVMLVGEAPGAEEDQQGVPFVGKSGHLLDRMLASIGLDRTHVYIANVVPWRPPGNRTPSPQELDICRPFIERHIALVQPQFLVFIGAASAHALTGKTDGILRLRGKWLSYKNGEIPLRALPMLHPAYLLRNPAAKRLAWMDLLALKKALEEDAG